MLYFLNMMPIHTATKITNTSTNFLIQEKSTGMIDGKEIKGVKLDIETLY